MMSIHSNCENWRKFIPVPVCGDKPEFCEFYQKAWEIAYSHIRHIDGMPRTPYMDETL